MSMIDIFAFNFFKYSTMLKSILGDSRVWIFIGFLRGTKGSFR
jgi:hypothetical protein